MPKKREKLPAGLQDWARPWWVRAKRLPGGITAVAQDRGRDPATIYRWCKEHGPESPWAKEFPETVTRMEQQPRTVRARIENRPVSESDQAGPREVAAHLRHAFRAVWDALRAVSPGRTDNDLIRELIPTATATPLAPLDRDANRSA